MSNLFRDLVFALRQWRKYPLSNLTAILILAIGIGANTANFSLINALLLRPLPFPESERLVHLYLTDPYGSFDIGSFSMPAFLDLKENSAVFEDLAGYYYSTRSLSGGDSSPERVTVSSISANLLPLLGASPILGRGFVEEEAVEGLDKVALLSEGLWKTRFGGSSDVVGETFKIDGVDYRVVGVMPEDFTFPFGGVKIWRPMPLGYDLHPRTSAFLQPVGRLRPGVSRSQALEELDRLFRNAEQTANGEATEYGVRVVPLRKALTFLFDIVRPLLQVATVAYFFVLLIVCANVASLMLVRASERTRETALRRALGADRRRILRQFLTEGLFLALVGAALGALFARFAVRLLAGAIPDQLFRVGEISVDASALFFAVAVAVVTSVLFTLKPALQSTKAALSEVLKGSSTRSTGGRQSRRLQNLIVIAEISLAVTLLAGTSLLVQSFFHMKNLDPGFDPENVLTFEMLLPGSDYADGEAIRSFYDRLTEQLDGLPGVTSASAIDPLPLNFESFTQDFDRPGSSGTDDDDREQALEHSVGVNFFSTMDIELLEGRDFASTDSTDSQGVVIVNRTLSQRFWPGEGAVGKRLRLTPENAQVTIIGVVEDSKSFLMNEKPRPAIYQTQSQEPRARNFMVLRTAGDPSSMVTAAREAVRRLDPNLPLSRVRPLSEVVDASLGPFESSAMVLAAMTLIAFILSGLGLWGVVAYTVGQSTQELGVRQALGAERRDLLKLVLRHGTVLTLSGLAIGLVISTAGTYFLSGLLFGVSRLDPATFAGIALLMATLALMATLLPAWRATRVDPAEALRHS